MTIENEKTKKISDEEVLRDMKNTKIEVEAYQKISQGYSELAELPEQDDIQRRLLHSKSERYRVSAHDAKTLLGKISKLAEERGLS